MISICLPILMLFYSIFHDGVPKRYPFYFSVHPKKNTKIYEKVDLKPESAVYTKGEKNLKCERACQIENSKGGLGKN